MLISFSSWSTGEDSKSSWVSLCSFNIFRCQACEFFILQWRSVTMLKWFTSMNKTNLFRWFSFFTIQSINRIKRVTDSNIFWSTSQMIPVKFLFNYSSSMTLMSFLWSCSFNIFGHEHVYFSRVGLRTFPVSFRFSSFDVFYYHVISKKIRWSRDSSLNFGQIVLWILRINSLSSWLELDTLRFCPLDIIG